MVDAPDLLPPLSLSLPKMLNLFLPDVAFVLLEGGGREPELLPFVESVDGLRCEALTGAAACAVVLVEV